jgi:hypothetical protein
MMWDHAQSTAVKRKHQMRNTLVPDIINNPPVESAKGKGIFWGFHMLRGLPIATSPEEIVLRPATTSGVQFDERNYSEPAGWERKHNN